MGWQESAACVGEDPRWFFPQTAWQMQQAKRICADCPVRVECYEFSQTSNNGHPEQHGIWSGVLRGGFEMPEREKRQTRRPAPKSPIWKRVERRLEAG